MYELSAEPPPMPLRRVVRDILIVWEVIPAAGGALIATCYTLRHEIAVRVRKNNLNILDMEFMLHKLLADFSYQDGENVELRIERFPDIQGLSWIFDPKPGVMLVACLVYGYSISSYSYKRQHDDKYQTGIFVLAICGACSIGAALGESANVIMLGYIPWAVCLAVLLSGFVHWIMRTSGYIKLADPPSYSSDKRVSSKNGDI